MKSNKNISKSAQKYLISLLANTEDKNKLFQLIEAIMTEKEQEELINRIRIFAYLQKGTTQREIRNKLGVGIATVSRGAKAFRQYPIDDLFPNLNSIVDNDWFYSWRQYNKSCNQLVPYIGN